jgi:acetate kinase
MRNRISIATTMGFTALDGLPMGTRGGELDAGVVLHLIQQKGMSAEQLVDLLYRRSGMLGLSGILRTFASCWPATIRGRALPSRCFAIASPAI